MNQEGMAPPGSAPRIEGRIAAGSPLWEKVADRLDRFIQGPTGEQLRLAQAAAVELPSDVPAFVAAVLLKHELRSELFERLTTAREIPEHLLNLEAEIGVTRPAQLRTNTKQEVSAWYQALYATKTVEGLRRLQPSVGDVVIVPGLSAERRVISSIGDDGKLHMRGRPPCSKWPNHVLADVRVGHPGYEETVRAIDAKGLNDARYDYAAHGRFQHLDQYQIDGQVPTYEAVRALEELLDSGERREEPFQQLVAKFPALLACTVLGGWSVHVIPKQRLGAEHVTDFLVLSVNSLGPQWVAVELEAPRHRIETKDGSLAKWTRHAVKQIADWREWLTDSVSYAQTTLGLHGLTNRVPGLVIIGRDHPRDERDQARSQTLYDSRTAIHSWDWLLRHATALMHSPLHLSDFARDIATKESADRAGIELRSATPLPAQSEMT